MPEVEEVGSDFVNLSWEKPSDDGGGRITGYIVERKEVCFDFAIFFITNCVRPAFGAVHSLVLGENKIKSFEIS